MRKNTSLILILVFTLLLSFFLYVNKNDTGSATEKYNKNYFDIENKDLASNPSSNNPSVFSDTFSQEWIMQFWGGDFSISSVAYKSSGSLGLNFKQRWSGFDFKNKGFDTSNVNALSFSIRSGTVDLKDLYVYFYTDEKASLSSVQVVEYIADAGIVRDTWYLVRIPLLDMKAENMVVKGLIFESASTGSVLIDEIRLINATDLVSKIVLPADSKEVLPTDSESDEVYTNENSINQSKEKKEPIFSENIYLDGLLSGWVIDGTSYFNVLYKNSYDGQYAINFKFTESWGEAIFIHPNGVSIDLYEGILMTIKRVGGNENVQIILYDDENKIIGKGRIGDFVSGRKLREGEYMQAYIPFRNILKNKKVVTRIILTSEKPVDLSVDNFKFSGEPTALPFGAYYTVASGPVFNKELLNGWYFDSWDVNSDVIKDDGLSVVRVSLNQPGAGLLFKNNIGVDSRIFKSIIFNIKSENVHNLNLSLTLYDINNKSLGSVWLNDFISEDINGGYVRARIPFTAFTIEGNTENQFENAKIGSILFSGRSSTDFFYIDNIRFDF